jgi:hypothetical protein
MPDTAAIQERFKQLPKVVQDAINSSDVEKHMRELADKQKLHVDQWQTLENEVMLALLGFKQAEELEKNLLKEVGVSAEVAHELAININNIVFEPIRQELERQLEHPEAQAATVSGIEATRTQILGTEDGKQPPQAAPAPTPATPAPEGNVARAPSSGDYKPGATSAQRKTVVDDPYREPPA